MKSRGGVKCVSQYDGFWDRLGIFGNLDFISFELGEFIVYTGCSQIVGVRFLGIKNSGV